MKRYFASALGFLLGAVVVAMAQVSISQLPAVSSLSGSEPIPAVQSGVTKQTTPNQIRNIPGSPLVGIFQGTVISPTYGGTGVNNGSRTLTLGGNTVFAGPYTFTGTLTGNTAITFPTSGTLATTTSPALAIVVGSTAIMSGINGDIEYNNGGLLGEKGVTGTGGVVLINGATLTGTTTANALALGGASIGSANLAVTGSALFNTNISVGAGSAITSSGSGGNMASGAFTAVGTSGATLPLLNGTNTWSGVQTFGNGDLSLSGSSSGNSLINAPATGGGTATLPAGSGTLVYAAGAVSSFSAGTTGFTPNSATTGAVTLAGTLGIANGGTNCAVASITCFNNITGFSAAGTTGTTSTNVVFSGSPSIASPTITGAFTATGLVTLPALATQATNTIVGNATSGTASPTALAIGTCSTASSALIWTTNTGFGCNTSITANAVPAANLTGATLASGVTASSLTSVGALTSLGVSGAVTVTSASAASLSVGRLGATTPAFQIDSSAATQVAGLKVTGAATGGTVAITTTDSGTNANLSINAKSAGTIAIGTTSTGGVSLGGSVTLSNIGPTTACLHVVSLVITASSSDCLTPNYSFASGLTNKFRNGPLDIWQRGTAALATSATANGGYTADGWQVRQTVAQATCSQDVGTGGPLFSLKCIGATSNTDTIFRQRIESSVAAPLAGRVVTVEFWMKQTSGSPIQPLIETCYASTTDVFSTCTADTTGTGSSCASNTWCEQFITINVNALATQGYDVALDCNVGLTAAQACWITGADIRATPGAAIGFSLVTYTPELRPIGIEMPFNLRYYQNIVEPPLRGVVLSAGLTAGRLGMSLNTIMRASPALAMVGNLPLFDGTNTPTLASISLTNTSPRDIEISGPSGGVLIANAPVLVYKSGGSSAITLSAEL